MKKIIKLILIFQLTFFCVVCASSCNANKSVQRNVTDSQKISEHLYKINNCDVIQSKDGFEAITMSGMKISQVYDGNRISTIDYNLSKKSNSDVKLCNMNDGNVTSVTNCYAYNDGDELKCLNNNGQIYYFEYDDNNNFISGAYNDKIQYVNEYDSNDNLIKTTYPSGDCKEYKYINGQMTSLCINDNLVYSFEYSNDEIVETNHVNNMAIKYSYDEDKRISSFDYLDNDISGSFKYDGFNLASSLISYKNRLFETNVKSNSIYYGNYKYCNQYNKNGRKNGYKIGDKTYSINYSSDDVYDVSPLSFSFANNEYKYNYDTSGNICSIIYNGAEIVEYDYNDFDQLISEYYCDTGSYIEYKYDNRGNILSKVDSNGVTNYVYDSNNRLISINDTGVRNDLNGNIIRLNNANLEWTGGKLLSKYYDDTNVVNYTYGPNGIRTSKTINGKTTNYCVVDNRVILEYNDDDFIYYMYDNDFNLIGFSYQNQYYFYVKNHLGDIMGIVDSENNMIVSYSYDAYGNILEIKDFSTNGLSSVNHYTYRGYRFDAETNLYYLNSRYYSPSLGRFISEDDIKVISNDVSTEAFINLYSYAQNNPIKYVDPNGDSILVVGGLAISVKALVLLGAAVIVAIVIDSQADNIANAINTAYNSFVDLVKSLIQSMPSLWDKLTKSSRPEVPHIVAKSAARAAIARSRCSLFGIDVWNDPNNLVPIKARFHRKLHTNIYYDSVNAIIVPCISKNQIYGAMNGIKLFLLIIDSVS